jgi:hypothetical protein
MNDEILKKLGYNNIALEMMLKRYAEIDPSYLIMESEIPSRNPDSLKDPFTQRLDEIESKLKEVGKLIVKIKSHPNEERYDQDSHIFPMHKRHAIEYIIDALTEIENIRNIT